MVMCKILKGKIGYHSEESPGHFTFHRALKDEIVDLPDDMAERLSKTKTVEILKEVQKKDIIEDEPTPEENSSKKPKTNQESKRRR